MGINEICDSVGAIIRNDKGEYLVLYRLEKPTGLALPAGHLRQCETSGDAIRRAVWEKTGIRIIDMKRTGSMPLRARCHFGFEIHWLIGYEVLSWDGVPELKQPHRYKFMKFMPPEEIGALLKKEEIIAVDPVFILKSMGIL